MGALTVEGASAFNLLGALCLTGVFTFASALDLALEESEEITPIEAI